MKNVISKTTSLVLLLLLCISFISCEKEGVYNPKQKIKNIYVEIVEYIPKYLSQVWSWEKNKLVSITYYNNYTEYYYYEKNKLVKVEDNYGDYFQITYKNSKFDKIDFFTTEGKHLASWTFSYNNNKVSKIVFYDYDGMMIDYYKTRSGFLSTIIPKECISETTERTTRKNGSKFNENIRTFTFTYNGDNIKEIKMEMTDDTEEIFSITYSYTAYDKMLNPFYCHLEKKDTEAVMLATDFVSSKNNPLELIITRSEEYEEKTTINYSYTYDKKFPIELEIQTTIISYGETYTLPLTKHYYEYE